LLFRHASFLQQTYESLGLFSGVGCCHVSFEFVLVVEILEEVLTENFVRFFKRIFSELYGIVVLLAPEHFLWLLVIGAEWPSPVDLIVGEDGFLPKFSSFRILERFFRRYELTLFNR